MAINTPPTPTPVAPRRTAREQPAATRLSPIYQGSPHQVRIQLAEPCACAATPSRPSHTARLCSSSSRVTAPAYVINLSDEESDEEPQNTIPLPSHYFGPNTIITPEQLSQSMESAAEGAYFVVTQGLEPGIYANWYT